MLLLLPPLLPVCTALCWTTADLLLLLLLLFTDFLFTSTDDLQHARSSDEHLQSAQILQHGLMRAQMLDDAHTTLL